MRFLTAVALAIVFAGGVAAARPKAAPVKIAYEKKASFAETLIAARDRMNAGPTPTNRRGYVEELSNQVSRDFPLANTILFAYRDFSMDRFLFKSGIGSRDYKKQTGGAVLERLQKSWLVSEEDKADFSKSLAIESKDDENRLHAIEAIATKLHKRALAKAVPIAYVRRRSYGMRGTNATMFALGTGRGAAICTYDPAHPEKGETQIFETKNGFIFDIHPSFDGKTLLMSYKEDVRKPFHIWEIRTDGTGLRQITKGPYHDVTPVYYPDGRIVFSSSRSEAYSMCQNFLAFNLFVCKNDGSDIRRFDFTTLCSVSPSLAPDGSILCSRWEYMDKTLFTWQGLWSINPNGRQLKLYYGNTLSLPDALYGPKAIPDTDKAIYVMAGHHHPPVSDVAIVDRKLGLENPKASWKITNATPLGQPAVGRNWRQSKGPGDLVRYDAYSEPWPYCRELSVVSFGGNRSGRASAVLLDHGGVTYPLFADKKGGCYSVVALNARKRPPAIPGDCPQEAGKGTFYVQDVYQGLLEQGVKRGQVKRLRVFRQVPKKYNTEGGRVFDHYPVIGVGTYYVKEYYGSVPVDENGSAYFEAPSNVELYFTAVDKAGKEIQRMGSVTQITTGETVSCIGCHEDRLSAPQVSPNSMKRLQKPADKITPPSWGAGPVDYAKQVQPVWDKHCIKCHNGKNPKGKVDMTGDKTWFFNMSYDSLCMRDSWNLNYFQDSTFIEYYFLGRGPGGVFPAMKSGSQVSNLTKMLESGHHDVKLSADEYERIFVWIDANIPYYGTWDMTRPYTHGGRTLMSLPRGAKDAEFAGWQKVVHEFLKAHKLRQRSASINFSRPELSRILLQNLAKSAGGWQKDEGKAIFKSKDDPEYKKLLKALQAAGKALKKYPRIDMPGAKPIPQKRDFGRTY